MAGDCDVTLIRYVPWVEHVEPPALGAVLSRRWRKREALIAERDRLRRCACGGWREQIERIDERLEHD